MLIFLASKKAWSSSKVKQESTYGLTDSCLISLFLAVHGPIKITLAPGCLLLMYLETACIGDGEVEIYWASSGKNFLIYKAKAGQQEEVNFPLSINSLLSLIATISAPNAASATS